MVTGTVYGVVLNDRDERNRIGGQFAEAPYKAPPEAPVVYIKPRGCVATSGADVFMGDEPEVEAAPTLALLIGRDATKLAAGDALDHVAGISTAIDVTVPHDSYYRPVVPLRCRDGFLPMGDVAAFVPAHASVEIITTVDGTVAHRWSPDRLVRDMAALIADLSSFMTLSAGDVLLVGLPHDAPRVGPGQTVTVEAAGLAPVTAHFRQGDAR